ncbi:ADP-ribose pyrophosphatase YjhB (NUDIX family) [Luteibacter rhizovicinus]|uniref:ADP-ribose pyrophosphatase YjhB (NUDIX family) n=1 Tax=Luteibacter rhizovicinus TaxID=242606 RepID=A0A4R3YQ35_9GAMM|nr:NUDIX hydrolase [Luteibacter rhizovicinus]TCV93304.1 ADP-ribose pyrophosphatase YjhB (NUDIX family) [Luteibacter rhizovicinus]
MKDLPHLRFSLASYAARWPDETDTLYFAQLLDVGVDAFHREHTAAHFTASAWLVSGDSQRVLLTHHRKLNRWLQLGGHADGDLDLERVALREAQEESGIDALRSEPAMFDVDRHRIPARGDEPEHWHYDVRYIVRADDEQFAVGEESLDLQWCDITAIANDEASDASLRRMARKWLERDGD